MSTSMTDGNYYNANDDVNKLACAMEWSIWAKWIYKMCSDSSSETEHWWAFNVVSYKHAIGCVNITVWTDQRPVHMCERGIMISYWQ